MRLEQSGSRAFAVSDEGSEHDSAIDLATARLLGGRCGGP
jgi:hypothetical protein